MVHDPFSLFRRIKRTIWAVYDTSIYLRGIEKVQNHDPRGKIDKNIEASRNILRKPVEASIKKFFLLRLIAIIFAFKRKEHCD